MARQVPPYITGTFNGMCYYKMGDEYYVRKCPDVSKRKRKEAPSYEKQRQWNGHFTDCSKLSSSIYRQLPKEKRRDKLQQEGTGLAVRMTKEGKSKTEIEQALMKLMGLSVVKKEVSILCEQVIEGYNRN